MKTKNINSLLMEIVLATLLFALSATVILEVFVTARSQSDRSAQMTELLTAAQNLADETYLNTQAENASYDVGGWKLQVEVSHEATEAGELRRAVVTAVDADGTVLMTLPCTRYVPGEEAAP